MTFIIATNNAKKLLELWRILNPLGIRALSAKEAGVSLGEVEETGETFEENARLKARAALDKTGMPALADDSGLMVDALNGEPGVYSARYGGEGATDAQKNEKLLKNMENVPKGKRTARFVSAICCLFPDGREIMVRGECEGSIAYAPRGEGGFGYDPVFLVGERSYAQLTPEEKDAVSHRGQALRKLSEELKKVLQGQE